MGPDMPDTELPEPKCIALVVCDDVYTDSNGKRALVGLFTDIKAENFPIRHTKMCVFVSLTELRKQTQCKLDIVRGDDHEPILEMGGPLPQNSPTTICDLVLELNNVTFPGPGMYFVRFFGHGKILAQRPISVGVVPIEEQGDVNE
jgi:hypothetical protein